MSLFDEHNKVEASVGYTGKVIEHIYDERKLIFGWFDY